MDKIAALELLKSYPRDAIVQDLYDTDQEFSSALLSLYPDTFEYPDFSHRKIGDIIKSLEKRSLHSETSLAAPMPSELGQRGASAKALNDKYADTVFKGNFAFYDALEIHGVRDLNAPDHPDGTHCEIDDYNPQFYSVYAHGAGNGETIEYSGIDAVGDFTHYTDALEYAKELSEKHNYPIHDFTLHSEKVKADMAQSKFFAEQTAREKPNLAYAGPHTEGLFSGKVMAAMEHHVVLSVGLKAMIIERGMLGYDQQMEAGSNLTVEVGAGKARVVPEKAKAVGIER